MVEPVMGVKDELRERRLAGLRRALDEKVLVCC